MDVIGMLDTINDECPAGSNCLRASMVKGSKTYVNAHRALLD